MIRWVQGSAILTALTVFGAAFAGQPPPELTVFVGRLLSVSEAVPLCEAGKKCVNFDTGYQLEYQVLQEITGRANAPTLTIVTYAHLGLDPFAYYPEALVFVYQGDENIAARSPGFPVAMTTRGDWAYCGDPYDEGLAMAFKKFSRVVFTHPVGLSPITEGPRADAAYTDPFGAMRPGTTKCKRAVLAKDLAAYARLGAEPGYGRVIVFKDE